MTFTAGCMICLLAVSDSFVGKAPKTAASTRGDTLTQQWCADALKRLDLASAMKSAEAAHQARVDANLLCAKAVS